MPLTPKDPKIRQRANKTTTNASLIDKSPITDGVAPDLPTRFDEDGQVKEWHEWVSEWWVDIWDSPMASEYTQADVHGLVMLMDMQDRYWRKANTALGGEIRLQRQCYGLTAIDRRRLQWEIKRSEPDRKPLKVERPERLSDPRSALRSV